MIIISSLCNGFIENEDSLPLWKNFLYKKKFFRHEKVIKVFLRKGYKGV